ncbi:hypothetical protein [Nocardia huaxiensis]|nr:hypothetical protein [Nocardia huaxiensis]
MSLVGAWSWQNGQGVVSAEPVGVVVEQAWSGSEELGAAHAPET